MLQKVDEIERAILETVYDEGSVGISNGSLIPASQVLKAKFPSEGEQQAVTVTLQYLLEKRYLFPYFDDKGNELRAGGHARGITPKGIDRLRELRHPRLDWIKKSWFPLVVAATSAAIGVTNIVVN